MGGATLAGCFMSDEQQATLDKLANKADEIVDLVEDNMSMQNAQLTKEEAAEKILLARNYFLSQKLDVKMTYDRKDYRGFYDKLYLEDTSNMYILKNEGVFKYVQTFDMVYEDDIYVKCDCINDIYYDYRDGDVKDFGLLEFDHAGSISYQSSVDICIYIGCGEITPEMIVDVEVVENGYKFTITNYEKEGKRSVERYKLEITLQNDRITEFSLEGIM